MRKDPESVLRLAWSVRCPFVSSRTDTSAISNSAPGALSVQVRVSTQNACEHPLDQLVPLVITIALPTSKALEKAAKLRVLFPRLSPSSSNGESLSTKSWVFKGRRWQKQRSRGLAAIKSKRGCQCRPSSTQASKRGLSPQQLGGVEKDLR